MKSQVNLRLPEHLMKDAEKYAKVHHYGNLQELAKAALREKIMEKNFDDSFTQKEVSLIERLVEVSVRKGHIVSEKELRKVFE